MQTRRHPIFTTFFFRRDGHSNQGFAVFDVGKLVVRPLGAERVACMRILEFDEGDDIASRCRLNLLTLVSVKLEDLPNAFALVARGIEHFVSVSERPRIQAQIAQFPHVLFGRRLENEGHQRLGRPCNQGNLITGSTGVGETGAFSWRGEVLAHRRQQLVNTDVVECIAVENRDDLLCQDGLAEAIAHLLSVEFALNKVGLHERLVGFCNGLHQVLAEAGNFVRQLRRDIRLRCFSIGVGQQFLGHQVDDLMKPLARSNRKLESHGLSAESLTHLFHRALDIDVGAIEFVEEDEPRK